MSRDGRRTLTVCSLAAVGVVLAGCSLSSAGPNAALSPAHRAVSAGQPATGRFAGSSTASPATAGALPPLSAGSGLVGESVTPASPLVIRDGTVMLDVAKKRVVAVFDSISSAAEGLGGFVASSSGSGAGDAGGASIVVRVPSSGFGSLVRQIDAFGKVEAQSETGQNVTAESIDLSARIANLKAEERSLRTLLSRAGSIAAILQVQDQLFGVEGDIEQLSAQEGSLVDRATFATLTVELNPVITPVRHHKRRPESSILRAVKLALHNTALAARAVVLGLGWGFPLLVLGLVLFGAWRIRRRAARRRAPVPSAPGIS